MGSMISELSLYESEIPFVFWSAMCFYVVLAATLLIPRLRRNYSQLYLPAVPSTGAYVPFLDVVRGLAILWVASFHAWQWLWPFNSQIGSSLVKQGFKGVAVFAVLSGFLAYQSLANKELSKETIWAYSRSRFIRLYPVYILSALYPLAMGYVRGGLGVRFQDVLAEVFLLPVFSYPRFINPVAWFIHVLILFYLIFPVWMAMGKRYRLYGTVAALVGLCLLGEGVPRTLLIMRYFVMGAVTAEVAAGLEGFRTRWAPVLLAIGGGLIFTDLYLQRDIISQALMRISDASGLGLKLFVNASSDRGFSINNTSIAIGLGFSMLLLGIIWLPKVFDRLSAYPLRVVGLLSYSIYMLHGIILIGDFDIFFTGHGHVFYAKYPPEGVGSYFSLLGLYFPSFILVAALSYALIERPLLKWRRRIT